jgi:hypothetical protein
MHVVEAPREGHAPREEETDESGGVKGGGTAGRVVFVPVSHVRGSLLSRGVTVALDRLKLPTGMDLQPNELLTMKQVCPGGTDPFALSPGYRGAWLLNSAMLAGGWIMLVLVLRGRELLQFELLASSLDEASWYATMRGSFALGLFESWVVVDSLKVLCLTLTCKPALASCGLAHEGPNKQAHKKNKGCEERVASYLRKPLRRAHKILDVLL